MVRTIVVGDVHGCVDELRDLLRAAGHVRGDRIVLVGDLVAKGPDSQGVVALAREEGALAVRGNHDAHALAARDEAARGAPLESERRRVVETLAAPDWEYLERLPLFLRLGADGQGGVETVVVHAGCVPGVAIELQSRDHLLTLRSIAADGRPSKRIEGSPWAELWRGPEHLVFGHDAVRGLQEHPLATGLDTGCVYGRRLTALVLPERRLISVPARRAYATGG